MIGFGIMMWFVSFVVLMVAIPLLQGAISYVHGKVFDAAKDKVGYTKQLGRPCLLISFGAFISGLIAILIGNDMGLFYSLAVLLMVTAASGVWFLTIQKQYMK